MHVNFQWARPFRFGLLLSALSLAGPVSVSVPARAAVVRPVSLKILSSRAAAVVVALPGEHHSRWTKAHRIVTSHQLRVTSVIAGRTPQRIEVETLGGRVGDVAQRVFGEAALVPNKPILLFLFKKSSSDAYQVLGMAQGAYPLQSVGHRLVIRPRRHLAPVRAGAVRSAAAVLSGLPLVDATRKIRSLRSSRVPTNP